MRWAALFFLAMLCCLPEPKNAPLNLALADRQPRAPHAATTQNFYQVIERNLHGVISHPVARRAIRFRARSGASRRARQFTPGSTRAWTSGRCGAMRGANRSMRCARSRRAKSFTPASAAGSSNYGRYVVVEHRWGGSSLLQPLRASEHDRGDDGQAVGRAKNSASWVTPATGINRERAHVHVELNLLLNDHFEEWHADLLQRRTESPWHLQRAQSRRSRSAAAFPRAARRIRRSPCRLFSRGRKSSTK